MALMPDYAGEIEFHAPDFTRPEFRMLRHQLVPSLTESEEVEWVHVDRSARRVVARVTMSSASSSRAAAKAGALARTLQSRLRKVRAARLRLRVELSRDEDA